MNILGWIKDILTPVEKIIDNVSTTKEEKLELRNALVEVQNKLKIGLEGEITKRWEADSNSDSKLAKNIRPMTLIYLMFLLTVFAFTDGNIGSFTIQEAYITLFQALAVTAFGGYFVLRGVEKISKNKKGK